MDDQEPSSLKEYVALKSLRENIYAQRPNTFNATDTLEDIPGQLRTVSPFFNDVIPSRAIISSDPVARKLQIRKALQRIKDTKTSKSELGRQMLHNTLTMGLGSLPIGFMLSAGINLMGFRSPRFGGKWRAPMTPIKQVGKIISQPSARNRLLHTAANDAFVGAGIGAASGAGYPLLAYNTTLRDRDLYSAADLLQKHPYATSLPVADIMSILEQNNKAKDGKIIHKLKNVGTGAGIGAATGVVGAYTPAILSSAFQLATRGITKRPTNIGALFAKATRRDLVNTTAFMGGMGGLAGGLSDNIIKENNAPETSQDY